MDKTLRTDQRMTRGKAASRKPPLLLNLLKDYKKFVIATNTQLKHPVNRTQFYKLNDFVSDSISKSMSNHVLHSG